MTQRNLLPGVENVAHIASEAPDWPFVNADLIAAELNPDDVEAVAIEAGRRMLAELDELVAARRSFAFETTLSGRAWARRIGQWREAGYRVRLIFLWLQKPAMARNRVADRVSKGGHNIPPDTIDHRWELGLKNFHEIYKPIVSSWELYDNSEATPILLEKG